MNDTIPKKQIPFIYLFIFDKACLVGWLVRLFNYLFHPPSKGGKKFVNSWFVVICIIFCIIKYFFPWDFFLFPPFSLSVLYFSYYDQRERERERKEEKTPFSFFSFWLFFWSFIFFIVLFVCFLPLLVPNKNKKGKHLLIFQLK